MWTLESHRPWKSNFHVVVLTWLLAKLIIPISVFLFGVMGSEMTLNYRMMVGKYPNLKEEVDSSISGCEISSPPDGKLAGWSPTSCALAMAYRPSISTKKKKKKKYSELLNVIQYECNILPSKFTYILYHLSNLLNFH